MPYSIWIVLATSRNCTCWPSCTHILKLLTDRSGLKKKAPIKWIDEMQKGFDRMHLLMAANALAAYPNHNKRFDIYTDASDFQLGACIIQEGRPVAYFSYKLTKSQQNRTTMEKECFPLLLLSKNLKVCFSVQTFMFLRIIKT